jgi:hypothetical protein
MLTGKEAIVAHVLLGTVPEEVESFAQRHALFVERFSNIKAALAAAFVRTIERYCSGRSCDLLLGQAVCGRFQ